jgi:enamine deaminase RidA (YjgF/YER057c/UK114 family)
MKQVSPTICAAIAAVLFAGSPVQAAELVRYDDGPSAGIGGPISESARLGDLLFLAGQIGEDKDGNLVPGGIKAEAEPVMLNIKAALARRGLAIEHVVKCISVLEGPDRNGQVGDVAEAQREADTALALGGTDMVGGSECLQPIVGTSIAVDRRKSRSRATTYPG